MKDSFVRVADLVEVEEGTPKAVRVDGHSVALFLHDGELYATDNQCPHMGYPLTRGIARGGVLTCDWHGYSYDMAGGGCFTGGCDDLDTFSVQVRDGAVFVDVASGGSKRPDAHFLLLQEGLNNGDSWTLSKAIAILLAKGVSERETLELIVRHMGRHITTHRHENGGHDVAQFVNGLNVARRYEPEDRLIPLMMAASAAAGTAGDRPQVEPLPPPVDWPKLAGWVRFFASDKMPEGIEKCLITARRLRGHDGAIVPLLLECAVLPHFLGQQDNLRNLTHLAELLDEFGWDLSEELVCNLAGKMLGRGRPVPMDVLREAMDLFTAADAVIEEASKQGGGGDFDENAFSDALVSGDIATTFGAVSEVLRQGASIDRIATTMVLLAADRMARTPVGMSPGWHDLAWEMALGSSLRSIEKQAGFTIAARACYHAAWRFFDNRWLNISTRKLPELPGRDYEPEPSESAAGDGALQAILEAVESIRIRDIGRMTRDYLNSGHSGNRLLSELGLTILKDDNGWSLLHTLRTVFDEWEHCAGHPAQGQLLVGLARWATDARRSIGSQSAAQTAQRFARGETAVELYE